VHAYATEEAMESIVENLLENAASFTDPGGTVEVTLNVADSQAQLTVADTGPGVPQQFLPQIFERNFSARPHSPDQMNGGASNDQHFGLGLWIVRRNVAYNRSGGGFAVTVSLKVA
jgi:two-component system sensor histidine kinase ChvG